MQHSDKNKLFSLLAPLLVFIVGISAGAYWGRVLAREQERTEALEEKRKSVQRNLLFILGHSIKVDRRIDTQEVVAILSFYKTRGSDPKELEVIRGLLKRFLQGDIDLAKTCYDFENNASLTEKKLLFEVVSSLVKVDGGVSSQEQDLLRDLTICLNIPSP